jgi:uncharacterized membrane protein
MDIVTTADGWAFLLRWIHFLAGITWIGILYYFNLVQTPFFATELGGQARGAMVRGLLPNALWWFRWGAMFTLLSGLLIFMVRLHQGVGLGTPYMTAILTGALFGTLMFLNVWLVIWPAQKVVIRSAEQVAGGGAAIPEAAARGQRAGLASRTNMLLSIPMLFFMGSASHFAQFTGTNDWLYWIGVLVIAAVVEWNGILNGPGAGTQKHLSTVSGTLHVGLALTLVLYVWGSIVL